MANKLVLKQQLHHICVNPFVHKLKFRKFDYIRIYIIGTLIAIIRIIPIMLFMIGAAFLARTFCCFLSMCRIKRKSEAFHKWSNRLKVPVFWLIRCALFFAGFYWIRVKDKRRQSGEIRPTIIPCGPHSTFLDVVLVLKLGVPSIVSRYENSKIWLIGAILTLCDPVYVKREDKSSRMKAADDIKERAEIGPILIFPEGTCGNRSALLQFKMGAFLPKMPVQPVVIRWHLGDLDTITWVEEGPALAKVFYTTLCRFYTSCEIIKLAPYTPNQEEIEDSRLFADNVCKNMCDELGLIQSFYSYDDVMYMGFANEIRVFRSPTCIKLLKVCYKVAKELTNQKNSVSNISEPIKKPKLAPLFSPRYLGFGEDFEHTDRIPSFYIPKEFKKHFKNKKKLSFSLKGVRRLPLSGVLRKDSDSKQPAPQIAVTSELAEEKRLVYETFCEIVEKIIDRIEEKIDLRPIESSKDLASLLDVEKYPNIAESASIVDLLKTLEHSTTSGPNTLHLLVVLHLCDCREPNLWMRIKTSMILLSAYQNIGNGNDNKDSDKNNKSDNKDNRKTLIDLKQFKTLLWYLLGLQEFNDEKFIGKSIDFDYVKSNLKKTFQRAVEENAGLLD